MYRECETKNVRSIDDLVEKYKEIKRRCQHDLEVSSNTKITVEFTSGSNIVLDLKEVKNIHIS